MVRRILVLAYGAAAYLLFLAVLGYTIGFLANAWVPKGIDDGVATPVWAAVLINAGLFAVQHSVMARPWFKRWWVRIIPATIERSTFVLTASLAVALLLWQWRPLPEMVWSVPSGLARNLLWVGYAAGWVLLVASTLAIGHFDLFGLRQVLARAAYRELGFRQPLLYRIVRHPIMAGFLVAFWVTPDMSMGRLLFAVATTGYIMIAVRFEEHDLKRELGEPYRLYAERVPRFVPWPRGVARQPAKVAEGDANFG